MSDFLIAMVFALPMAVFLLNFVITSVFRLGFSSTFVKKDFSYQPTVSVLLPCFNEGAHVYHTIKSIVESNYPSDKIEIIAVDDCSSDDSYTWIKKAAADFPQVTGLKNPVNSGKHHSLSEALNHSTGDVLICIDSDCIFDKNAIAEMTSCFSEPTIAAVGGRVGISNPLSNITTQCQTLVYYYAFQIIKMMQNFTRNVTCISGCLFAIRREAFVEIVDKVKARNWLGIGVRDGEDRFMTHLVLLTGAKTYINVDAQCWTTAPDNLSQLFMQQLRWRRSGLRDLFWTLRTFWTNLKILHPLTIVNYILPGTLTIMWPAMYIYAFLNGWMSQHLISNLPIYFGTYLLIGCIFNAYAHYKNPEQKINPLAVGVLGIWFIVDSFFITTLALGTFDVGDWGTRTSTEEKEKNV